MEHRCTEQTAKKKTQEAKLRGSTEADLLRQIKPEDEWKITVLKAAFIVSFSQTSPPNSEKAHKLSTQEDAEKITATP